MKTRESGMPDETMWEGFFKPEQVLTLLGLEQGTDTVADFGCGYGTFTIPACRSARMVYAFDIDPDMVAATALKARQESLGNARVVERDFFRDGTGLPPASVDFTMLFNILHAEQPQVLLNEAFRITKPGGLLAVIHWNHDPATPRGPTMTIRPKPEQCLMWAKEAGFSVPPVPIALPPYHYGFSAVHP